MFVTDGLSRMVQIEARSKKLTVTQAKNRVVWLFLIVVAGILASWFWEIGWAYVGDPTTGLAIGPLGVLVVRVILSFIAAALTFLGVYNKIDQNTSESWVPYFVAFQNGFFWDALFQSIAAGFQTPPATG